MRNIITSRPVLAVAIGAALVIGGVLLFGADQAVEWIEALWSSEQPE